MLSLDQEPGIAPKPPADPNRPIRRSGSRTRLLQQSTSVDDSDQASRTRDGSLQDGRCQLVFIDKYQSRRKISKYKSPGVFCGMYFIIHTEKGLFFISHNNIETSPSAEAPRRVHSGPRERTTHLLEERGEGDGSETQPRTESRRYYFLHARIYISGYIWIAVLWPPSRYNCPTISQLLKAT